MVKFSAEDGKEDSRKRRCLSSSCDHSDSGEEDADARNDSLEKEDLSGGRNVNSKGGKESATVIMDLDILECPICYEIMNPPIFQVGESFLSLAIALRNCYWPERLNSWIFFNSSIISSEIASRFFSLQG